MIILLSLERLVAVYIPHKVKVIFSMAKVKVIIACMMFVLITWNVIFSYTKTYKEILLADEWTNHSDGTMFSQAMTSSGMGNETNKVYHSK